ncbi:Cytochrome P450 CYP749A22 [Linum grandiflorum]
MIQLGSLWIFLSSCLCSYLVLLITRFLNRTWWTPIRIQSRMRSQGIKGPPYRFFHGNTREIAEMRIQATKTPMVELSHNIFPRLQPHIYSWTELYGKNYLQWYGSRAQLVVTEPDLIKEVLAAKDGSYEKEAFLVIMRDLLGDGLVVSRGEKWTKMRRLANHGFHGESLKGMVPAMIASIEMMLERTAFGSSYWEGHKVFELLTKMVSIIFRNEYSVRIPGLSTILRTGDELETAALRDEIKAVIMNMVNKRKTENNITATDFLALLLKAYTDPDTKKRITVEDVVDECKTFYLAGHETATSSLTWTILLLAAHTEWQDRAREQVVQLFGNDSSPTPDGISRLSILSMIINESLRLYPPFFHVSRRVERDGVPLGPGKLLLPKGTEVYIPFLAIHHRTEVWGEEAQLFRPERFAEGAAVAKASATFMPFGLGSRSCVGTNFAITQMKIAVATILQRYRLRLSDKYVHSPAQVLTSYPLYGLQIVLEKL